MPADVIILFCADPLAPARVDPYFAEQARALRELGGTVAVIDHDALLAGDADNAVRRVPRDLGLSWYRGWMIPAARYADLATALMSRGVELKVPADRYRAAHDLPGWYDTFIEATPPSVWTPWPAGIAPDRDQVGKLVAPFGGGPAVVKDYVKSRKHEWAEACFIPDLADLDRAARV